MRARPATADDLDAVVAIERAAFADPWSHAFFADALAAPGGRFELALTDDGAVAGYLVAWFVADEGEIANLAVAPGARRAGVGTALLEGVFRAARAAGVRTMHLEVRDSNHAARALYGRFGFREIGRRRGYYRQPVEDAIRLRCDLPAST